MSSSKKAINITLPGGLLGFAFIAMKCAGYVTWPWFWVLCPFWLPWAGFLVITAGFLAVGAAIAIGFGAVSFASWFNNYLRRKWL